MVASTESGVKYSFSTANLFPGNVALLARNLGAHVKRPDISEVVKARELARSLGDVGLELVWRRGAGDRMRELFADGTVPVHTIHAPVYWNPWRVVRHRYSANNTAKLIGGSEFVLGWGETEHQQVLAFAEEHNSKIVMHPDYALQLFSSKQRPSQPNRRLLYELDWRPPRESPLLEYDRQWGLTDIFIFGMGANPDTSHELITLNPPQAEIGVTLRRMVSDYADVVEAFHYSGVATDPDNIQSVYNGGGSLPLTSERMTPAAVAGIREWSDAVRALAALQQRTLVTTFEAYGWSGEDRERSIVASVEFVRTGKLDVSSKSYPDTPTRRI
jgi:hypothetical protein